jgi:hypothetical protein
LTDQQSGAANEFPRGPAEDLWRRTLRQIRTHFGKLAYLASLRDSETGRYQHHGMALEFGEGETDLALRQSHTRCFNDWLSLNLEEQKIDLDRYLRELDADLATVIRNWLQVPLYKAYPPAEAGSPERRLFETDLAVVLEVFRIECGVAAPDPDA